MDISKNIENDQMCFACGPQNPISLKLEFDFYEENKVKAYFKPGKNLQGFKDVLHGGIISTVLDEAMAKVLNMKGIKAVTAEINVRFKKMVPVQNNYIIHGIMKNSKKNIFFTESYLEDENGNIYASAEAKFIKIK